MTGMASTMYYRALSILLVEEEIEVVDSVKADFLARVEGNNTCTIRTKNG